MADITLKIGGRMYDGWKALRVMRSLETVADTFELKISERWSGNDTARPILAGSACELWHGEEKVITGYVDEVLPDYDASRHEIIVAGRSKTGDLVDCSLPERKFNGKNLLQLARDLCAPFGIKVRAETDFGGPFKELTLEDGQPIFEFLEQAARIRAVRLVDDADGNLVIIRAGQQRISTPLKLGENIRQAGGQFSSRERFSDYVVQAQDSGDDFSFGEFSAQRKASASDSRIKRYRPTLILADGPADTADCKRRADWQRNIAFGRGQGIVYTVAEWEHAAGLWNPNALVTVRDDYLGINEERLIVSVQMLLDEGGKRSEIRVMPAEAFDLVPLPEPTVNEGWLE